MEQPLRISVSDYRIKIRGNLYWLWKMGNQLVLPIHGIAGDKFPADHATKQVQVSSNGRIHTRLNEDVAPDSILVTADIEGPRNLVVIAPDRMKEAQTVLVLDNVRLV